MQPKTPNSSWQRRCKYPTCSWVLSCCQARTRDTAEGDGSAAEPGKAATPEEASSALPLGFVPKGPPAVAAPVPVVASVPVAAPAPEAAPAQADLAQAVPESCAQVRYLVKLQLMTSIILNPCPISSAHIFGRGTPCPGSSSSVHRRRVR
ncbi:unnamed protein product [Symbiodinium natans]|uniref:Uncharacterized protein n=1 Tax=Symbiodinium natans TaxID=878477 RepID=A0A812IMH1_9DINO|nr:unnamed protein product [Symbiodinium natans]